VNFNIFHKNVNFNIKIKFDFNLETKLINVKNIETKLNKNNNIGIKLNIKH